VRADDFPYFDSPTPIGLAHRGGALHPDNVDLENSLAAFRTAVSMGYRYLETDVHATADGVLLAFHDSSLDRVTDATGLISDLPYAAVREARIGGTEPIPTVDELLEEFPHARVNIDVKAAGAVGPLIEAVQRHGAVGRVCVGSFSRSRLRTVRRALGPGLATAAGQVGVAAMRFSPLTLSRWIRTASPVLQVPTHASLRGRRVTVVTPALVRRVHALGKHLHVWTIDDEEEMHRLLDLGVDGLVSDRIDTLATVLAERGAPLRPPG
jgi:glycerophosphoryl diester phosphodiesterase